MEIKNLGNGISGRGGKLPEGATIIAKDLKKKSDYINSRGDKVNPATKEIIQKKEDEPANA